MKPKPHAWSSSLSGLQKTHHWHDSEPVYRSHRLALRFRQKNRAVVVPLKQDIRSWLPGHRWFEEKIALPKGLNSGEAKLDLVIIDEEKRPRVWFAIEGTQVDGWHALTSVDVL